MTEMRMLIVPAHLVKKIDENRGDLSQGEFLDFLIDTHLKVAEQGSRKDGADGNEYVTQEGMREFEQSMKEVMRNFLDFVVTYLLEVGKDAKKGDLDELSKKLRGL
jgi:hypothetical protein